MSSFPRIGRDVEPGCIVAIVFTVAAWAGIIGAVVHFV